MIVLDKPSEGSVETSRSVEDVLRDGYEFRFGDYLGDMFNLFGKAFGYLMGHSGIMLASYIIVYIILIAFFFSLFFGGISEAAMSGNPEEFLASMIWKMVAMWIILMLYVVAWVMPFRAGTYTFLMMGSETGKYQFGDFFIAMRTQWAKLIGLTLVIYLLAFGVMFLSYYNWYSNFLEQMSMISNGRFQRGMNPMAMFDGLGWVFLSYIPLIFLLVSASLSVPILLFKNVGVIDAFVASLKIVFKKWFHFFGLFILVYILTIAGVIVCGVGMLATIHFFPLVIFVIYKDIFITQNRSTI